MYPFANKKREENIPLVYQPCAKFSGGQVGVIHRYTTRTCGGYTVRVVMGTHTLPMTYLLQHMRFHTRVLTLLKGHEPLPGMVYSLYREWDTLPSLFIMHSCLRYFHLQCSACYFLLYTHVFFLYRRLVLGVR